MDEHREEIDYSSFAWLRKIDLYREDMQDLIGKWPYLDPCYCLTRLVAVFSSFHNPAFEGKDALDSARSEL